MSRAPLNTSRCFLRNSTARLPMGITNAAWIIPVVIVVGISIIWGLGFLCGLLVTSSLLVLSSFQLERRAAAVQAVAEEEGAAQKTEKEDDEYMVRRCPVSDSLLCSESEMSSGYCFSSEDSSDVEWPFILEQRSGPDCSDDSISDEESLIEIAIPSGHYYVEEESMSEVNEEDYLFEIDLSSI